MFPPLLRSDAEQEAERCTHDYNQKTENEKSKQSPQTEDHSRKIETLTQCVLRWKANGKAKKMRSGNQREEELLKKKHEVHTSSIAQLFSFGYLLLVFQRAEALVKKWDLLQVKEKEEKYSRLLQRLELQHKLIAKRDFLSKQLEREANEKHVKVSTRTHNKKIYDHLSNSTGIAVLQRYQETNDAGSQRSQ